VVRGETGHRGEHREKQNGGSDDACYGQLDRFLPFMGGPEFRCRPGR